MSKEFQISNSACSTLNDLLAFAAAVNEMAVEAAPQCRVLQAKREAKGAELDALGRRWAARRTRLEGCLRSAGDAACAAAAEVEATAQVGNSTAVAEEAAKAAVVAAGADCVGGVGEHDVEAAAATANGSSTAPSPVWIRTPRGAGIVQQGFLYKRSSTKMMAQWNRRWFLIDSGKLHYIRTNGKVDSSGGAAAVGSSTSEDASEGGGYTREHRSDSGSNTFGSTTVATAKTEAGGSMELVQVCDIVICTLRTLRDVVGTSEQPFAFEIISPKQRTYLLQAESGAELLAWKSALQECIESMLVGAGGGSRGERKGGGSNAGADGTAGGGGGGAANGGEDVAIISSNPVIAALQQTNSENGGCADCGNTELTWASINLGLMLCIECSGVHRSLGAHISKVKACRHGRRLYVCVLPG